jgi:ligand-binding sensor domain-containing protein
MFENINKAHGLPHNHVQAFLRDSKGFIWIGTTEGLCRFDGYSFKVFKKDPDNSNTIRDNIISRLFEDQAGKIWIAAGDYFEVFDPVTETFSHDQWLFNRKN